MPVRQPVVAGRFYEGAPGPCRAMLEQMVAEVPQDLDLPQAVCTAVAPHAGWIFSGDLATMTFAAIQRQQPVDTFIILGAVHRVTGATPLIYNTGSWQTPLGSMEIDEDLSQWIIAHGHNDIRVDYAAHDTEHSIEVLVPIIQHLFPEAKLIPIMVPPAPDAYLLGNVIAAAAAESGKRVVAVASTDLTHYGPSYNYAPMGAGGEGIRWSKDTNDKYFIDMALALRADTLVESAQMYYNACGAGAVAAAVQAAARMGAQKGYLLAHTTSAEIMAEKLGQAANDSVGYASIVFG